MTERIQRREAILAIIRDRVAMLPRDELEAVCVGLLERIPLPQLYSAAAALDPFPRPTGRGEVVLKLR